MTGTDVGDPQPSGAGSGGGWPMAIAKGVVVLVGSFVLLLSVPNRLLASLATRVTPNARDGIVVAWEAVCFVILAWALVAAQGRRVH